MASFNDIMEANKKRRGNLQPGVVAGAHAQNDFAAIMEANKTARNSDNQFGSSFSRFDQNLLKTVSDNWKSSWQYDLLDAEDMQRKAQGLMPKAQESKYKPDKNEWDRWLYDNQLPYSSEFSKAYQSAEVKSAQDAEKKKNYDALYNNFRDELYSAMYAQQMEENKAAAAEGRRAREIEWAGAIDQMLAQEKYRDVAKNFKQKKVTDEDADYALVKAMLANDPEKAVPNQFTEDDLVHDFRVRAASANRRFDTEASLEKSAEMEQEKRGLTPGEKLELAAQVLKTGSTPEQDEKRREEQQKQYNKLAGVINAQDFGVKQNLNTLVEEIHALGSNGIESSQPGGSIRNETRDNAILQMTPEERAIYAYHAAGDKKDADAYLKLIMPELKQRYAEQMAGYAKRNAGSAAVTGLASGVVGALEGIDQTIGRAMGIADVPEESIYRLTQQALQQENTGTASGVIGDLSYSVGNMLPSILAASMTGGAAGVSGLVMGAGAGGNAYAEARREGYSDDQAALYGTLIGASEAALQHAIGGVSQLGQSGLSKLANKVPVIQSLGKTLDGAISKVITSPQVMNVLRRSGTMLASMGSEGIEEYLQSVLEPVFRNAVFGEQNAFEPFSEDKLYSGIMGALLGGVFEGANQMTQSGAAVGQSLNMSQTTEAAQQRAVFEQDVMSLEMDAGDVNAALRVYDTITNKQEITPKDVRTINQLKGAVQQSTETRAEVAADMQVTRAQAISRLEPLYNAVVQAQQQGDFAAFQKAYNRYLSQFDVSQTRMQADEVKAQNKLQDANRKAGDQIAELAANVEQEALNARAEGVPSGMQNAAQSALQTTEGYGIIDQNGGTGDGIQGNTEQQGSAANQRSEIDATRQADGGEYAAQSGAWQNIEAGDRYVPGGRGEAQAERITRGQGITPEAEQSIQRHIQTVLQGTGQVPEIRIINEVTPEIAEVLDVVKSITGSDAFLYESNDAYAGGWADENGIFINASDPDNLAFVYGHEYAHTNPKLYAVGKRVLDALPENVLENYKTRREVAVSSADDADISRELMADVFGDMMHQATTGVQSQHTYWMDRSDLEKFYSAFNEVMAAPEINDDVANASYIARDMDGAAEYSRARNLGRELTHEALTRRPDMEVIGLQSAPENRRDVIRAGMENALSKNNQKNTKKRTFVRNKYSGTDIQITPASIQHGLTGNEARLENNSRLGSVIGDAVENAITVNELAPRAGAERTYLMMGMAAEGDTYFPYTLVVNQSTEGAHDVVQYDALHGAKKEYLASANMKMDPAARRAGGLGENTITPTGSINDISIADFLDVIKDVFPDGLSQNVLQHFGIEARPEGTFSGSAMYSRTTFAGEDGHQYSYQMPTIHENKDGAYTVEFTVDGKKMRLESDDRAALELQVRTIKQDQAYRNASRTVLNMREAADLFRQDVTLRDYAMSGNFNHEVAKQLRGMYLRNGFPQGGALSEARLSDVVANEAQWKDRRQIRYTLSAPQRLFEALGEWRNEKAPGAREQNYLEGERLKDTYWGYTKNQGAAANTWMMRQRDAIQSAFDGNVRTSALAQMLGEGIISEQEAAGALYDNSNMVVQTRNGVFVLDRRGQLQAMSSGGETVLFDDSYYKRVREARKEIGKMASNKDPKISNEDHLKAIRQAEKDAVSGTKPTRIEGDIHLYQSGNGVRATLPGGKELANIQNGRSPDMQSVTKLWDALAGFYEQVLMEQNGVLVENGYKPIQGRQDYFPHMGRNTYGLQDFISTLRGDAEGLPTEIAGLTSTFTPGKPFVNHMLERMGNLTEYDAIRGFNKYVQSAADLIHYTPAIQRIRQLERYVRENNEGSHNSALASWLHNYGNILANKKSDLDRGLEGMLGREVYTGSDALTKGFGAASVAGNLSSALSNFISLASSLPGLQQSQVPKAMLNTAQGMIGNMQGETDVFADKIPSLVRRFGGYEPILETSLERTKQKGSKLLGFTFDAIDRFATETVARAKYGELMQKGYTEAEAIKRTDDFLIKMFAERSKGMTPTIFNSKVLRPFAQFQLEPFNQLSHFRDLKRQNIGEQIDKIISENGGEVAGVDWAAAENEIKAGGIKDVARKSYYLVLMFLWNLLSNELMGRDQAIDPLGAGIDIAQTIAAGGRAKEVGEQALEIAGDQLPFASMFTGGRVPLMGGIEKVGGAIEALADKEASLGDKSMAVMQGAASFIPGGAQLSKTIRGIEAIGEGGSYTQSGRLRYPVSDDDFWKMALFGPAAAAPDGFDYQADTLSQARTRSYAQMVEQGIDPEDAYKFLQGMDSSTNAGKLVSIAAYDRDNDGKPDFRDDEMDVVAAIMGISVPATSSIPQQAKKEADAYIKRKRREKDLEPEKLEEAEGNYEFWATLMGW